MKIALRFEPALAQGNTGWRIDLCTGSRKKGTFRAVPITQPTYTLAQAYMFCERNRPSDYKHLMVG